MPKVKAYYDKALLIPITGEPSFYAYPIEVEAKVLKQANDLRDVLNSLAVKHSTAGFPRDAQYLADSFADQMAAIMKTQKRTPKNVNSNDTEQSD